MSNQQWGGFTPDSKRVQLLTLAVGTALGFHASAAQVSLNGQQFTVPDGFEVELVAGTNVVARPVSGSFDNRGRLYVTESSGSNEAPQKQLLNPTHRILRLEDTDGDGKFDKSTVFADKVMFPQGCLWYGGSVYVAAPPSIWKFTDTTGSGVADKREEWFKGGTLTGCANDIHGPHLGPDGYIYWTKGAFSEQTHTLGNGRVLQDRAAHIYRARPDGSDLGVVMTGGMDNPVEVAFTAEGEAVFTSTFIDFTQPGFRDGIGHAVYGGVFGKANDVLEDGRVKRTSPELMHPFYQAGPAAECALLRYRHDSFGTGYRDNLFATTFNLHKITRHILKPAGATYTSTDSDFLVSDSQDFHPTGVVEDADGSLVVVDTGGWYKLCCPSSQLAKPEVLGALYRVRRTAAAKVSIGDRPAAYEKLKQPPALTGLPNAVALRRAIWNNQSTNAVLFRDVLAKSTPTAATSAESAHLVRLAAEGLGRLHDATAVPLILSALGQGPKAEPVYQHSLVFALIEIAARDATRAGLKSDSAAVQRGAMVALDQMDASDLKPAEMLAFLRSRDESLRTDATWVFRRHPGWAAEGAGVAEEVLASSATTAAAQEERAGLLRILAVSPVVQTKIASHLKGATPEVQLGLFQAVSAAHPKEFANEWAAAVQSALSDGNPAIVRAAVAAARDLNVDAKKPNPQAVGLKPLLSQLAENAALLAELRLDALLAIAGKLEQLSPALLELVTTNLDAREPVLMRGKALQVLQRAKLDDTGYEKVIAMIPRVSAIELRRLLAVFEQQTDEDLGRALLASLQKSKAARNLPAGDVRKLFAQYPASVRAELATFLQILDADIGQQSAHLETLTEELGKLTGDKHRGRTVFNSAKAACTACHKMGYLGGNVGPDLTTIGQARTERDLLEAIIYPSASFVRSYEPVTVTTKAGEDYSGVLRKDTAEELILATGPNAEVRIARADVVEQKPGTVSVMPKGLDEQLSKQELADLLTFLKTTKWGPE